MITHLFAYPKWRLGIQIFLLCFVMKQTLNSQIKFGTEDRKVTLQEILSLSFDLSFLTQKSMAQSIYHDKVEKHFFLNVHLSLSFSTQLTNEIISRFLIGLEKKAFASVVSTSEGSEATL